MTRNVIPSMIKILILILLVGLLSACGALADDPKTEEIKEESSTMEDMDIGDSPVVPAGLAYAEGQEVRFIHTEASDPDVAKLLSDMMDSPVLYVPNLAKAPQEMLATAYVFKNGIEGMGPLGFQPDIFDNPPGSVEYSPLRRVVFVTWTDESKASELKSVAEVNAAENADEITLEVSDVVVNMPFITWPGGSR